MATTITPTGQHNDQRRDAAGPRRRSGGAPLAHRKTAPLRPDSAPLLLRSGRPPTLDVVEVLLARENGFCFGVKKAVELTEAAAETGRPVHNLGQVVHNPKISERLATRGVKVIKDPSDAKDHRHPGARHPAGDPGEDRGAGSRVHRRYLLARAARAALHQAAC